VEVVGDKASYTPWVEALKTGGVEVVDGDSRAAKTRVAVWPDPGGEGDAGMHAVTGSGTDVLICIGEWEGMTLGLLPNPGARIGGQAWSQAAQREIQSRFPQGPKTLLDLPSWPLACDRLAIFDARTLSFKVFDKNNLPHPAEVMVYKKDTTLREVKELQRQRGNVDVQVA